MTPLFAKLNLGAAKEIVVLNAPASFEAELQQLDGVRIAREAVGPIGFGLAFAVTGAERDAASAALTTGARGDATLWLAYPKGSSKRYAAEFNRDSGWDVMDRAGFDTVRLVALDADWSALRFRRKALIRRA